MIHINYNYQCNINLYKYINLILYQFTYYNKNRYNLYLFFVKLYNIYIYINTIK